MKRDTAEKASELLKRISKLIDFRNVLGQPIPLEAVLIGSEQVQALKWATDKLISEAEHELENLKDE